MSYRDTSVGWRRSGRRMAGVALALALSACVSRVPPPLPQDVAIEIVPGGGACVVDGSQTGVLCLRIQNRGQSKLRIPGWCHRGKEFQVHMADMAVEARDAAGAWQRTNVLTLETYLGPDCYLVLAPGEGGHAWASPAYEIPPHAIYRLLITDVTGGVYASAPGHSDEDF